MLCIKMSRHDEPPRYFCFVQKKAGEWSLEMRLTLELRISNFCDAGGHPLSAAVAILRQSNQVALAVRKSAAEEVVQVYGFCIRTLRLPVISVMIIGVMRLYNKRAVPDGRFRHHLFQAVFMRTTYPSRLCVFQVVKGPHSCRDRCYCSRWYVRTL